MKKRIINAKIIITIVLLMALTMSLVSITSNAEEGTTNNTEPTGATTTDQGTTKGTEATKDATEENSKEEQKPPSVNAKLDYEDPLFNRYYTLDEQGNVIEKQDAVPMSRAARSASVTHPSKYKNYTIYNCIDVSEFQGNIDWAKVKKAGITHAIIRVGYRGQTAGTLKADSYYDKNIKGATAAGIKVGVYMYSQALSTSEARAEADFILSRIKNYNITMPVVFDYEFGISASQGGRFYAGRISKAQMTDNCIAFCERVKSSGYTPMVYANRNMLYNYLNASTLSSRYKIWLAHYTSSTDYTGSFYMWQYTSSGYVNGISGRVDKNFIYEARPNAPTGLRLYKNGSDQLTITWKSSSNATGYVIYRSNSLNGTYKNVATISSRERVSWADYNVSPSTTYYYKIRSYRANNGSYYYSSFSNTVRVKTQSVTPGRVTGVRLYKRTYNSQIITWKSAAGANGYIVYRAGSKNGNYAKVETVSKGKVSWADYNVKKGRTYYYKIRAYRLYKGKYYYGSPSNVYTLKML